MLETFSNNFHAIKAPERVGQGNDYFMEPLKKAYSIDSKNFEDILNKNGILDITLTFPLMKLMSFFTVSACMFFPRQFLEKSAVFRVSRIG